MYLYIFQKINCRVVTPQMHYELRIILLRLTSQKMICYDGVTFYKCGFFPEKNPKTLYVLYDKKMLVRFTKGKIEQRYLNVLPSLEIYEFLIVELRLCSLLHIFMY